MGSIPCQIACGHFFLRPVSWIKKGRPQKRAADKLLSQPKGLATSKFDYLTFMVNVAVTVRGGP